MSNIIVVEVKCKCTKFKFLIKNKEVAMILLESAPVFRTKSKLIFDFCLFLALFL